MAHVFNCLTSLSNSTTTIFNQSAPSGAVNPKRTRHHEPQSTHIHPFYAHPCRDYRPAVTVSLGAGMKLKTIQAFALIALAAVILIGAVTGDFDTAELLMYTAIFVGLTAVHITTEDNI